MAVDLKWTFRPQVIVTHDNLFMKENNYCIQATRGVQKLQQNTLWWRLKLIMTQ